VERYGTAGVTLSMRIACCIPEATNTFRIYNTYSFFTATMVARTRLCYVIRTLPVMLGIFSTES
jgi:hypothetical protein